MKRGYKIFILLFIIFCFACAPTRSVQKTPSPTTAGMKEMVKGIQRYNKGCYKESVEYFFRSHEIFTVNDQLTGVAMSLNNIGNVYRAMGDVEEALLFFDQALAVYKHLDDETGEMKVLSNKAASLIDKKQFAKAEATIVAAENFARKKNIIFAPILRNKGIMLLKKKEYESAEILLQKALANTDPSHLSESAPVCFSLGNLMLETKRYKKAIEYFKTALKYDRLAGFYKGIADDLTALGSTFVQRGNEKDALIYFEQSIKIYALIGDAEKVGYVMDQLEETSQNTGDDIRVTINFVNRWLKGKRFEDPCR